MSGPTLSPNYVDDCRRAWAGVCPMFVDLSGTNRCRTCRSDQTTHVAAGILVLHDALRAQLTEAEARLASQGEQIAQLLTPEAEKQLRSRAAFFQSADGDRLIVKRLDYLADELRRQQERYANLEARTVTAENLVVERADQLAAALTARDEAERRIKETNAVALKVVEGFSMGVFVRDPAGDADAGWAMKLLPYLAALGTLARLQPSDPSADPPKEQG